MIQANSILLPLLVLSGWTFVVLLMIPYHRFKAGRAGQITAEDFRFGESDSVPRPVTIPNRNLMNLLEVPVLFYVFILILYLSQKVDALALTLAWIYVALRLCHSLVHLSYNNVMHRLALFAASNVVLSLIWLRLLVQIAF